MSSEFQKDIQKIGAEARTQARALIEKHKAKLTGNLKASVKYRVRTLYGIPDRLTISFRYYGIFVEKGVGRGANSNRKPKPWLSPAVNNAHQKTADKAVKHIADAQVKAIKF